MLKTLLESFRNIFAFNIHLAEAHIRVTILRRRKSYHFFTEVHADEFFERAWNPRQQEFGRNITTTTANIQDGIIFTPIDQS